MQPKSPLAAFAAGAHCWLMFIFVSSRNPVAFSANLHSQIVPSKVKDCIPFPEYSEVLLAHFCSFSWSF